MSNFRGSYHSVCFRLFLFCRSALSGQYVLVQSLADSAGAGIEFLDHSLYTLTQTSLIQVNCKYILAAVELLKAGVILVRFAYLKRSYNSLNLCKQRIR